MMGMGGRQRYGVWADWDHPYLTLDPEYEAAQINVFGEMVFQGYIFRGRKPVHWSPSSRTALAEAELEKRVGSIRNRLMKAENINENPEFSIDAGSTGNVSKFINYSCDPNLFVQCILSDCHDLRLARVFLLAS